MAKTSVLFCPSCQKVILKLVTACDCGTTAVEWDTSSPRPAKAELSQAKDQAGLHREIPEEKLVDSMYPLSLIHISEPTRPY